MHQVGARKPAPWLNHHKGCVCVCISLQVHSMCCHAGVQGVQLPPQELLQQQYIQHLHIGTAYRGHCLHQVAVNISTATAGAALLEEPCNWLPPKQFGHSAGALEEGAPAGDATMLPLPTRALLSVLHDHLTASLAQPSAPLWYSRVAGEVYAAYTRRVKQLVTQAGSSSPAGQGDHHSIGTLILEALRHVETTVGVAAPRRRHRA